MQLSSFICGNNPSVLEELSISELFLISGGVGVTPPGEDFPPIDRYEVPPVLTPPPAPGDF